MTEPLDFTAAGRKKSPPPPPQVISPPPRSTRTPEPNRESAEAPTLAPDKWPRRRWLTVALAVVVTVGVVAIAGYALGGRSKAKVSSGNAQTLARYCQLATEFDTLASSTTPIGGPLDTSASGIGRLIQGMGATIQELKSDAPAAIRSSVAAEILALQEAGAGNPAGVRSPTFLVDRQRIVAFEQKMCGSGGGSNDQ